MSEPQTEYETDTDNLTAEERFDYPVRSRFRKSFQPYGVRICDETLDEIGDFDDCQVMIAGSHHPDLEHGEFISIVIETREGTLEAGMGDWIMEDTEGHHYPIAHQELRKTYQPVQEADE